MNRPDALKTGVGLRFCVVAALLIPCTVAVVRLTDEQFLGVHQPDRFSWDERPRIVIFLFAERLFLDAVPILCAASGILAIGLSWHNIRYTGWASPGHVAVCITFAVFLIYAVRQVLWWWFDKEDQFFTLWYRVGNYGAIALAAGWSLLIFSSAWPPRAGLADSLRRILGWTWLIGSFSYWVVWAVCS